MARSTCRRGSKYLKWCIKINASYISLYIDKYTDVSHTNSQETERWRVLVEGKAKVKSRGNMPRPTCRRKARMYAEIFQTIFRGIVAMTEAKYLARNTLGSTTSSKNILQYFNIALHSSFWQKKIEWMFLGRRKRTLGRQTDMSSKTCRRTQ